MSKVWFITGTSRGLGRAFAQAALGRGDKVAATARSVATLADLAAEHGSHLLPLQLDVTDSAAVGEAVSFAKETFGRLDVVVNNAGYGLRGMVEELSETELRAQLETNFFGAVAVTRAALPLLRAQGSGHIVQVSSIGGVAAFPALGGYHASKWALEGLTESLAAEVASFGIKVTLIEPGGYVTDWSGSSMVHAEAHPAYEQVRQVMASSAPAPQDLAALMGDPAAAGRALLDVVDAEDPPLRVFFGGAPLEVVTRLYEQRLHTWGQWSPLSRAAQGPVQR